MKLNRLARTAIASLALALFGCGGGGGGIGGTGRGEGVMRFSITDAPSCGYDAVNVTIDKVRVHASADALDTDAGWSEIVLSPARRVDLLSLTNGVLEELGDTPLPAGRYTQLRLVLAENGVSAPLANSVVPTGQSETPLDTPGATRSGLKVQLDVEVPKDQVVDVVLDFDACKSVVERGHSGRYNLKPVVAAIVLLSPAGQGVIGYVEPAVASAGALISVQQDGQVVKATAPDDTGRFVLYPVPAGTYDLVVSASGRATAVMTGVPVDTVAYTEVGSSTVRIVPPPAGTPEVPVTGRLSPPTASLRALQSLTGGPRIEAAWIAVDPDSGAFATALPAVAPQRTAYAVAPSAIIFTPDEAAAGWYELEASADGRSVRVPVDVRLPVPPLEIVVP